MPVVALLFWLGVVGAIFDWRYIRAGGVRATAQEKRYLAITVGLCALFLIGMWALGGSSTGLGMSVGLFVAAILFLWELKRWRVRKAHPAIQR